MKIIKLKTYTDDDIKETSVRDLILLHIPDVILDFTVYDRKNDECLKEGMIEQAIKDGDISIEDIIREFSLQLYATLSPKEWKEYKEYQKNIQDESRVQNEI